MALEACFRTKRIVIFNPAEEEGVNLAESFGSSRLIEFLEAFSVRKCVSLNAEPWEVRLTLEGQQKLSKDSVNCSFVAAEWICFCIHSDVTLRVAKGPKHCKDILRECRMLDRSLYDWHLMSLQMLHRATQSSFSITRMNY